MARKNFVIREWGEFGMDTGTVFESKGEYFINWYEQGITVKITKERYEELYKSYERFM